MPPPSGGGQQDLYRQTPCPREFFYRALIFIGFLKENVEDRATFCLFDGQNVAFCRVTHHHDYLHSVYTRASLANVLTEVRGCN